MNPARAGMHGAVTVINATATGQGASLAVHGGVEATWEWTESGFEFTNRSVNDQLARAVYAHMQNRIGGQRGATIQTTSSHPPERGLKTSSGAAAAMLAAAAEAAGQPLSADALIHESVAVSKAAGVTLTGAFDDQCAVVLGGCCLTDNATQRMVQRIPVEPWTVAVWVPDAHISKSQLQGVDTASIQSEIQAAVDALAAGDVPAAMTRNGAAFTQLYAAAGLPVTAEPAEVALAAGALGAGLSGTGPAVAALFAPGTTVALDPVAGGRWTYTEVVP